MKKLLYILLFSSVALTSCVQEVDDVFDKPVAVRLDEAVQEYRNLLISAEHGWLMEYYPHSAQGYGGYAFTMKFSDNDEVAVRGENWLAEGLLNASGTAVTSLFSVKKDMGPTLNFDTYNTLFHYFSDPDTNEAGGTGKGFEGDYEFQLLSHTDTEIVLRGKKTNNYVRMVKLDGDATVLLNGMMDIERKLQVNGMVGFVGMVDGVELFAEKYAGSRYYNLHYGEGVIGAPYMITATGIQLYQPITIGGVELYRFTFSYDSDGTPILTEVDNPQVVLRLVKDPTYLSYEDFLGAYTLAYDDRTTDVTVEALEEGKSFVIRGLPNFDIVMQYNAEKGRAYVLSQKVATVDGRDIWICAWDPDKGQLAWTDTFGLETCWDGDTENFVLNFADFGSWNGYTVKGFYYYSFDAGGFNNGAHIKPWGGANWFCVELKSLTKVKE